MGLFKKLFPSPKSFLQGQKKFLTASPKEKLRSLSAPAKALSKGDIAGALTYGRSGAILQEQDEARAAKFDALRRADAAQAQFDMYSQAPMMPAQNLAPITPPSYGNLDDYLARIQGGPAAYAPRPLPMPQQPGMQPGMQQGMPPPMQPGVQQIPFTRLPFKGFRGFG